MHDDSASVPDEPLVKFRNLSIDLVPIDDDDEGDETTSAPPPPPPPVKTTIITALTPATATTTATITTTAATTTTAAALRRTIAQLEAEFTAELDKSSMLVDLQHRYMRRRLASAATAAGGVGGAVPPAASPSSSSSATADILSILMEMVRAQQQQQVVVAVPAEEAPRNEIQEDEFEESLLERLREHLERPEYYAGGGEGDGVGGEQLLLAETMVSERSRDYGRFIPTAVPRFGLGLELHHHEREE
ncbi:hypothetical protein HDU86_001016 [Geranomyces michiganensis]|nr:hypothetical protein HDU86_001016 [Geranomyces michiganensis]